MSEQTNDPIARLARARREFRAAEAAVAGSEPGALERLRDAAAELQTAETFAYANPNLSYEALTRAGREDCE